MQAFSKVLIANRGEVVARIARSCRDQGLWTVAVFSDADAGAPFVSSCDEAVRIGGTDSASSYLDIAKIVDAARRSGADAVHPGYGFLAENASFARACVEAGLVFVGPPADVIERLGSKQEAKALARTAGVPVIEGYDGADQSDSTLAKKAHEIGFPILVKASAGGGGKGMRVVRYQEQLDDSIAAAKREAASAFGDSTVLIERYIERPRHIEIQILADASGNVVHLGERECSIQRRHQKIIEECPSPAVDDELRRRMGDAAVTLARAAEYVGAGTVEFIVDRDRHFYFLEVNTRLQVEHPITELVTGVDIVREQLRIANGEPLDLAEPPPMTGHAIECRLYAEDPDSGFLPQSGTLADWHLPEVAGLRVEAALAPGVAISPFYDPMLAKLCCYGADRAEALARMRRTLALLSAPGLPTNQAFLRRVLEHDDFAAGELDTHFIDEREGALLGVPHAAEPTAWAAVAAALFERSERARQRELLPALPLGYSNSPLGPERVVYTCAGGEIELRYRAGRDGRVDVEVGALAAGIVGCSVADHTVSFETDDGRCRRHRVVRRGRELYVSSADIHVALSRQPRFPHASVEEEAGALVAPMPSKVIGLMVEAGQRVEHGQPVAILEAMKMEHEVGANATGTVTRVAVSIGDQLEAGQLLVVIEADSEEA